MSYKGDQGNKQSIEVVAGVLSTSELGYVRIGGFPLNIDGRQDLEVRLFSIIETTNAAVECHIRLFDITGSGVVGSDPLYTSSSLVPELRSALVTLGAGDRVYEVQMKMGSGLAPDKVTCSHCRVEVNWSDF